MPAISSWAEPLLASTPLTSPVTSPCDVVTVTLRPISELAEVRSFDAFIAVSVEDIVVDSCNAENCAIWPMKESSSIGCIGSWFAS